MTCLRHEKLIDPNFAFRIYLLLYGLVPIELEHGRLVDMNLHFVYFTDEFLIDS